MPNSEKPQAADTILTLPKHTTAAAVGESCRETFLAFINDSARWTKGDLAMWLMGPYEQVVRYAMPLANKFPQTLRPPSLDEVDARHVDEVLRNARAEVMAVIRDLADPERGTSFAFAMIASGFVVRGEDAAECVAFVPTARARRLADRVLSLIAVDYLTSGPDYDASLAICERCSAVSFDPDLRERGVCERHGSGIYTAGNGHHKQQTIPYTPESA